MFEHKGSVQHGKDGGWVERADTRSHYKTNRSPFLHIFSWSQWLETVRNVSFYTQLEDLYEFRRCFWIKQCWTPASQNRATLVRGRFDSTESGYKFGKMHFVFTIYMQNVWFYIRISCSWLCLWSFLLFMLEIKQLFGWADSASDESSTLRKANAIVVRSTKCTSLFCLSFDLHMVCCIIEKKHSSTTYLHMFSINFSSETEKIQLIVEWLFSAPTFCFL